jgi:hypothetical protein
MQCCSDERDVPPFPARQRPMTDRTFFIREMVRCRQRSSVSIWRSWCFRFTALTFRAKVVVTKRRRRDAVLAFFATLAPCVVGMEACAGSHFWAREIARLGHTVRLMAPQDVKP